MPFLSKLQKEAFEADLYDTLKKSFENVDFEAHAAEELRLKSEAIKRAEWVVETKTSADGYTVEISAVIKGSHGYTSWGWPGEHKHIVLSTSKTYGAMSAPLSEAIVKQAQWEANEICLKNNK